MDLGIQGRTVLVVGGGGGLGAAIAWTLASEGAAVAVAGLSGEAAERVRGDIVSAGGRASALALDLARLDSFPEHLDAVRREHGDPEILVNLTGGPPPTPASGVEPHVWAEQFRSMVLGVIHLTDLVLPAMREQRWGRIITSTSSGVIAPIPNLGISNALRMSLVGWSKTLSREVADEGVTANVIIPGRIATGRVRRLDEAKAERQDRSVEDVIAESTATIPTGRYGRPEEYAAAVAFLASNQASYITGATLRVDGGMIASS